MPLPRTGIAAFATFVLILAACGEPTPTAELPVDQLLERAAESKPKYVDTDCKTLLSRYNALDNYLDGPTKEDNIASMIATWVDPDDPPTKEQVHALVDHCRAQ